MLEIIEILKLVVSIAMLIVWVLILKNITRKDR